MGGTLTAEEVRAATLAAMPAPLGELYHALSNEVSWIHMKWKEFLALYAAEPGVIELLNAAAPAFFHHLQGVLWEDVLLHLCRLTDRPRTFGKDNLSLARVCAVIPDAQLQAKVQSLVDIAEQTTAFARDWRNRHLAHRELPPLTGQQPQPLARASRQHVEDALAAIRRVMNCIEHHYEHSTTMYEHFIEPLTGAKCLLFYLRKGVDAQRAEDEALLARRNQSDPVA